MTETIASLVGAIIGAIITTSFWFVQHRIEQKDDLNNERRQDKRELVKNIMRNRMNQRALCIDLNQIPLTFYDDPQAKELTENFWRRTTLLHGIRFWRIW